MPLPWSGERAAVRLQPGAAGAEPWLPQPEAWKDYTAEGQSADPSSMLTLYKKALHLRREIDGLGDGPFAWLASGADVLAFERGPGFVCAVNFGPRPSDQPVAGRVVLASGPLTAEGRIPADTAVWIAR